MVKSSLIVEDSTTDSKIVSIFDEETQFGKIYRDKIVTFQGSSCSFRLMSLDWKTVSTYVPFYLVGIGGIKRLIFSEMSVKSFVACTISTNSDEHYICSFSLNKFQSWNQVLLPGVPTSLVLIDKLHGDSCNDDEKQPASDRDDGPIVAAVGFMDGSVLFVHIAMSCENCNDVRSKMWCCCGMQEVPGCSFTQLRRSKSDFPHLHACCTVLQSCHQKLSVSVMESIPEIDSIAVGFCNGDYLLFDCESLEIIAFFREPESKCPVVRISSFQLDDDPRACVFLFVVRAFASEIITGESNTSEPSVVMHQLLFKNKVISQSGITSFTGFSKTIPRLIISFGREFVNSLAQNVHMSVTSLVPSVSSKSSKFICFMTEILGAGDSVSRFVIVFDLNIYCIGEMPSRIVANYCDGSLYTHEKHPFISFHKLVGIDFKILHTVSLSSLAPFFNIPDEFRTLSEMNAQAAFDMSAVLLCLTSGSIIKFVIHDKVSAGVRLIQKSALSNVYFTVPMLHDVLSRCYCDGFDENYTSLVYSWLSIGHTSLLQDIARGGVYTELHMENNFLLVMKTAIVYARDQLFMKGSSLFTMCDPPSFHFAKETHFYIGLLEKASLLVRVCQSCGVSFSAVESPESLERLIKYAKIHLLLHDFWLGGRERTGDCRLESLFLFDRYQRMYFDIKSKLDGSSDCLFVEHILAALSSALDSYDGAYDVKACFEYPPTSLRKVFEVLLFQVIGDISLVDCYFYYVLKDLNRIFPRVEETNFFANSVCLMDLSQEWRTFVDTLWLVDHQEYSLALRTWMKIRDHRWPSLFKDYEFIILRKCMANGELSAELLDCIGLYTAHCAIYERFMVMLEYLIHVDRIEVVFWFLEKCGFSLHKTLQNIWDIAVREGKGVSILLTAKLNSNFKVVYDSLILVNPVAQHYSTLIDSLGLTRFQALNKKLSADAVCSVECQDIKQGESLRPQFCASAISRSFEEINKIALNRQTPPKPQVLPSPSSSIEQKPKFFLSFLSRTWKSGTNRRLEFSRDLCSKEGIANHRCWSDYVFNLGDVRLTPSLVVIDCKNFECYIRREVEHLRQSHAITSLVGESTSFTPILRKRKRKASKNDDTSRGSSKNPDISKRIRFQESGEQQLYCHSEAGAQSLLVTESTRPQDGVSSSITCSSTDEDKRRRGHQPNDEIEKAFGNATKLLAPEPEDSFLRKGKASQSLLTDLSTNWTSDPGREGSSLSSKDRAQPLLGYFDSQREVLPAERVCDDREYILRHAETIDEGLKYEAETNLPQPLEHLEPSSCVSTSPVLRENVSESESLRTLSQNKKAKVVSQQTRESHYNLRSRVAKEHSPKTNAENMCDETLSSIVNLSRSSSVASGRSSFTSIGRRRMLEDFLGGVSYYALRPRKKDMDASDSVGSRSISIRETVINNSEKNLKKTKLNLAKRAKSRSVTRVVQKNTNR